jgi:hypothetical protein
VAAQPARLPDQVAQAARQRGASQPTTAQLVSGVRAFVLFHGKRHPRALGRPAVTRFLEQVVGTEKQPSPAPEAARSARELLDGPVFLHKQVREIDLGPLEAVRARRPKRLPVVLAPAEMAAVLDHVPGAEGMFRLMARLLYGCGLRLYDQDRGQGGRPRQVRHLPVGGSRRPAKAVCPDPGAHRTPAPGLCLGVR